MRDIHSLILQKQFKEEICKLTGMFEEGLVNSKGGNAIIFSPSQKMNKALISAMKDYMADKNQGFVVETLSIKYNMFNSEEFLANYFFKFIKTPEILITQQKCDYQKALQEYFKEVSIYIYIYIG